MRLVSAATEAAIASAVKSGSSRAHARVLIHDTRLRLLRELPNVKSITINRSVDMEVGTCSIELFNTENIPLSSDGARGDDFGTERMGWYSPTRGESSNLGLGYNSWGAWIVPDRLVYTFEGYGIDRTKGPLLDPYMYPSGKWLIDDVIVKPDGIIIVECRDVARELVESVVFPPAIQRYPLYYEASWFYPDRYYQPSTSTQLVHGWWHSAVYHHSNIYDRSGAQMMGNDSDRSQPGHPPELSFSTSAGVSYDDGPIDSTNGYWKTAFVGNPDFFIVSNGVPEANLHVEGVHVVTDVMEAYISFQVNGAWVGDTMIPSIGPVTNHRRTVPANLAHPVFKVNPYGDTKLPFPVDNPTMIKFIGSSLRPTERERPASEDHVAKIYDIRVTPLMYYEVTWHPGYWDTSGMDYVDIVRELCRGQVGLAAGHIIESGTGPIEDLGVDIWDQKPLLDGVRYVKDILGYVFWVDHEGFYYFRPPNVFTPGNFESDWTARPSLGNTRTYTHTLDFITLPESSIHQLQVKMSSRNKRDYVFVANVDGNYGATASGYDPYNIPLKRVSGWTDQRFASQEECRTMAELIALRQASKYRGGSVTIPGDPRIELDDQIVVRERVTATDYRFYVSGITSRYDSISGIYQYDLTLEWLGTEDEWLYNPWTMNLSSTTIAFINAIINRDYV